MNRALAFLVAVVLVAAYIDPLETGLTLILIGGVGLDDRARAVVAWGLVAAAVGIFPDDKCRECACDLDVTVFSLHEHLPWSDGHA